MSTQKPLASAKPLVSAKPIVQRLVVAPVILHRGKMLLLQRSDSEDTYPGIWEIPGGKREPLETTEQALVRETKEETGLTVKAILPYSTFEYVIEKPTEIRDATQLNILCKVVGSTKVHLSDEHQAFVWTTERELARISLTKNAARAAKLGFKVARKLGLVR